MAKTLTASRVLSFQDYQRMCSVIRTVLNGAQAITDAACVFYAVAGTQLLRQVHGLHALPVAGAAFFRLDDRDGAGVSYGTPPSEDGATAGSDETAFHCWIECEGTVIDLMAPFFQESIAYGGGTKKVDRRMFQKPTVTMCRGPFDLVAEGDFYLEPNRGLTQRLLSRFVERHAGPDLVGVCAHWYRRSPQRMEPELILGSNEGRPAPMRLKLVELTGAW